MAVPAPGSQREIRRRNLSRVLYAVAEHGPSSRASAAARLGLTRTAVSTLVDELLRGGLLTEQGPESSGGGPGRPGTALALADSGPCGLGAEIGVDHLAVCAVDLRGRVRARTRVESRSRDSGPEATLGRLGTLVDEVASAARTAGLRPSGLGVAVPGLVARGTSTVVRAPNLGWHDTDIASALAQATPGAEAGPSGSGAGPGASTPPLTVDNEANLAALAELWLGGARMPRDFVHVSAEVGIGAAVVLDGELLRGTRGFAGELGHTPVRPDGPRCACGGQGCLEQYAGERAILRASGADEADPRGPALTALAERAASGEAKALQALDGAGEALGIALAGTVNLLDPGAVVLGGTLARFAPWLLPSLEEQLTHRTAAPGSLPELLVSQLGSEGPLLGAAHTGVRAVLDDPPAYAARR
ncbi:ROK family transcriptional regulator [Streptomyces sp. NBC_01795]|uniref:ROK family transcriptional regulator n=1 Tax=unclassified Streptomyces TaxID=2593676 RepID=UPI002DDA85BE|nr:MULTISPECIES: ROK family transcriptional regulator [unclassified Streptomyces]WSA90470.1 ROK family transcriptional regulator [Streptomyces sp. NBC_01795]WSB74696.1 ROK family transcriptional regulator [Streptomyces sp. NBC_01775]